MNITKNYDNYKAQDKKMKYPSSNSKIFRKAKGSIKYKIITSKTSSSHSQPKPALNYC